MADQSMADRSIADLASWLTLARVPGIGASRFHALLCRFGSPAAALSATVDELAETEGVGPRIARAVRGHRDQAFVDRQLRLLDRHDARIVTCRDRDYPERLRDIYDPPPLLFVSGGWKAEDELSIAIVGTRFTTAYGRKMAESFSAELSAYGFTVVSGLARGVDTLAHRTALRGNGRTVAVLGSGLDRPYPAENRKLMATIREHGAVMTEHPFGTGPDAVHFPQRNRIISGATLGTIVVEAGKRSGALITARFALDQGREVFAVPGSPGRGRQRGGEPADQGRYGQADPAGRGRDRRTGAPAGLRARPGRSRNRPARLSICHPRSNPCTASFPRIPNMSTTWRPPLPSRPPRRSASCWRSN